MSTEGYKRIVKGFSENQQTVKDIADAMHLPPPQITGEYAKTCEIAASFLGNPAGNTAVFETDPVGGISSEMQIELRNAVLSARNNVFQVVNRTKALMIRAKGAGFSPPDNPFSVISELNGSRTEDGSFQIDQQKADSLILNIAAYLDLLLAEEQGKIDFTSTDYSSGQLSSVSISLDGHGGSGDVILDLLRFVPDSDAVKRAEARNALAVLDFKKRVPRVIFTAAYAPQDRQMGCVIGWKRIADASGYVVRRTGLFDGKTVSSTFSNDQLLSVKPELTSYVKKWILNFYDDVDESSLLYYVDGDVTKDAYYNYSIQAYQLFNQSKSTLFKVDVVPVNLTYTQRAELRRQIESIDPGEGSDTISPYPILARFILGNDECDWVLAGVNTRASINRGDGRSTSRKYSYLAAQMDFIFSQMDQGLFVVPKNISDVTTNVDSAISRFGVSQVVEEVLSDCGALYFFEGKDAPADTTFDPAGSEPIEAGGLLQMVMTCVDPESATLDLRKLAAALPQVGSIGSSAFTKPQEIKTSFNPSTADRAEDEIQFFSKLDLREGSVDLTTFSGVSLFMRTVRIISDVGPFKGAPIDEIYEEETPPQRTPPPPAPEPPAPAPPTVFDPPAVPVVVVEDPPEKPRRARSGKEWYFDETGEVP